MISNGYADIIATVVVAFYAICLPYLLIGMAKRYTPTHTEQSEQEKARD